MISRRRCVRALAPALGVLALGGSLVAQTGEWPQFAGPHRNYKVDSKGLASSWPDTGPRQLWSRELGGGWSSIAVDNSTLYTMYRKGDQDVVIAMEAATGKTIWEYVYDAPFVVEGRDADIVKEYHLEQGTGPISTPTIVGDRLFTVGASSWLHAFDKKSGKILWKYNLIHDLNGYIRQRGYGPSPLVYKDTIILPNGSAEGSIIAFNQKDGKIAWRKHDFRHAYSSPMLINVDGQEQAVLFMSDRVIGFDPNNGDLFWSHQQGNSAQGTHVSLPVWGEGNLLFYSAAYGVGGKGLRLTQAGGKTTVQEVWHNPKLRMHYNNAVRVGDVIYGCSGDFGPAFFSAWKADTGEILWQERTPGRGMFTVVDGRFIIIFEDGTLALVEASPTGMKIISKVELLQSLAWTVPTVVGKTMYIRDQKKLLALDLS